MIKTKSKFLIVLLFSLLLLFNTFCFATDVDNNSEQAKAEIISSDLYISQENQYDLKDIVNGNVFVSVNTVNIDSSIDGGTINGNVFAAADTVNIKSDIIYSDTEKDDIGNPRISVNSFSSISGNLFVVANKFILEPGCEIKGDLYVCANEIILGQNSKISGNVFVSADTFTMNCQVGYDLYANVKNFDMQYYGYVSRDLHLNSKSSNLNGYVYRNSFIYSEDITMYDKFINEKDFNIENSNSLIFAGLVKGDCNINSKTISFNNDESTCQILGNLNYSSDKKIDLQDGIVSKDINYSKYKSVNSQNFGSNIANYILDLAGMLILVTIVYLLVNKFMPKYIDKISEFSGLSLLKYLGIGIGILILVPIISILLLITVVGIPIGIIIILIYTLLIMLSTPIFIIYSSAFIKQKMKKTIKPLIVILITTVVLSLIKLIPYVGFIVSLLTTLIGLGILTKSVIKKK